jgi:hypothetical protein
VLSDCRNLNPRDLTAFPVNIDALPQRTTRRLVELGNKYLKALKRTARTMIKSGKRFETFDNASCKPILDEIDQVLASYFGLSDDELAFIVNFDLKYRGGSEEEDADFEESGRGEIISLDDARVQKHQFKTLLPLIDLVAAAGAFGPGQSVQPQGWVDASALGKLDRRMFVARVSGRSMEPRIRDGDLVVFRAQSASPNGSIVLAQCRGAADPETGGSYTIKRYVRAKRGRGVAAKRGAAVLESLNKEFKPISIPGDEADEFQIIAEFVRVLEGSRR